MQANAKPSPKKAGTTGAGSVITQDERKRQGKKRSVAEAVDGVNGTAKDPPKRQKNVTNGAKEADLQVCAGSAVRPLLQIKTTAATCSTRIMAVWLWQCSCVQSIGMQTINIFSNVDNLTLSCGHRSTVLSQVHLRRRQPSQRPTPSALQLPWTLQWALRQASPQTFPTSNYSACTSSTTEPGLTRSWLKSCKQLVASYAVNIRR